jgi:hypothetical protein
MKKPEREALPLHLARKPSNIVGKEIKKSVGALGPYVERMKNPDEVQAGRNDLWERPEYKTGDGDNTAQVPRAGSLAAFSLPSKGNRT